MEKSSKIIFSNQQFIVFGEDFNRHPHSLEHLLRPLFKSNNFIWVETIGMRSPKFTFYDIKRIVLKIKSWVLTKKNNSPKNEQNVTIIKPFMIPYNQFKIIRFLNSFFVSRSLNKTIKKLNFCNPILITSVPNSADYIPNIKNCISIYYCVDEFSLWPGLNYKLIKELEDKLIYEIDYIIATSSKLASEKTKNVPTKIIGHGVDFEMFNIGKNHTKNSNLNICYFGLLDERTNQDILLTIAQHSDNFKIHIFGNVVCNISKLKNYKNIIFHGKVDYSDLPKKIFEMDVFILPYFVNQLTEYINPLKLKEYLATGRPVITTSLREVIPYKDFLKIANSPQDFVEIISNLKEFYNDDTVQFINNNETWGKKTNELVDFILKNKKN